MMKRKAHGFVKSRCSKTLSLSSRRSFVPAFYLPLLTRSSSITKFCCAAVRRAAQYRSYRAPARHYPKGVRTYLVYQTDAGDFQHIALNRLDAAELMQDAFEHPENFDLEDYSAKIRLNDARGKTMRLSITSDDPEFVRILSESPL